MASTGKRWLPIHCKNHDIDHGVSPAAAMLIIESAMNGELITIKGNTLCVLDALPDTPRRMGDRMIEFAFQVDS